MRIDEPIDYRSGFVTLVGRSNVGKSTLVNALLEQKVSIVSEKPQTTRTEVRGVLTYPNTQAVFCDTPGIHKPKTLLGRRLNATTRSALTDMDVVLFLIEANSTIGLGDRFIAGGLPADKTVLVLNKIDLASKSRVLSQLSEISKYGFSEYFPVSAFTGEGVDDLRTHLMGCLPKGPCYYPEEKVRDTSDSFWVAELVREQLLAELYEEIPYSIATRVTDWDWPVIRCEILVERDSQKGIVIGKGGEVLKRVGSRVREQLPSGAFLELVVRVEKNWQKSPKSLEKFGY